MEIKEIQGTAKITPFWKRLVVNQENDGRFRLTISYDEVCEINGKIIRDKMTDIFIQHEELLADEAFPMLYPLLRDYVRRQLKNIKPEYFEESEQSPS